MSGRNDERSSSRGNGGSEASPFTDFSTFREMIRKECKAARAEHEAAAAQARMERETAAAEQRRLMAEVYELNLQLVEERRSRTSADQNGNAIGLDGRRHIEPMRWIEASPLQALHVREYQRAAETASAELCRFKEGRLNEQQKRRQRSCANPKGVASSSSRNGDSGVVPIQKGPPQQAAETATAELCRSKGARLNEQQNGDSGSVPIWRGNGESQVKHCPPGR